jgi:hypothetical protein
MDQPTTHTTLAELVDELSDPTLLTSLSHVLAAIGLGELAASARADAAWVAECEDHDHELEALITTSAPPDAYEALARRHEGCGHRAFAELIRSEASGLHAEHPG